MTETSELLAATMDMLDLVESLLEVNRAIADGSIDDLETIATTAEATAVFLEMHLNATRLLVSGTQEATELFDNVKEVYLTD